MVCEGVLVFGIGTTRPEQAPLQVRGLRESTSLWYWHYSTWTNTTASAGFAREYQSLLLALLDLNKHHCKCGVCERVPAFWYWHYSTWTNTTASAGFAREYQPFGTGITRPEQAPLQVRGLRESTSLLVLALLDLNKHHCKCGVCERVPAFWYWHYSTWTSPTASAGFAREYQPLVLALLDLNKHHCKCGVCERVPVFATGITRPEQTPLQVRGLRESTSLLVLALLDLNKPHWECGVRPLVCLSRGGCLASRPPSRLPANDRQTKGQVGT